jgi:hypothetical protein
MGRMVNEVHYLRAATGGFDLYRDDFVGNTVKIVIVCLFVILFYCFFFFSLKTVGVVLMSVAVGLLMVIIKLVVMFLNHLLDGSVDAPGHEEEDDIESAGDALVSLPAGVSIQLWENRRHLFDERRTVDDRAMGLIEEGFDPEEVFTLARLIESGEVTRDTELAPLSHRIKSTVIQICGKTMVVKLDRGLLSRICTRPSGFFDVIRAGVVSFVVAYLGRDIAKFGPVDMVYLAALYSLSIFSMISPPGCDPYSTTLNDPVTGYTRPFFLIILSGLHHLIVLAQKHDLISLSASDLTFAKNTISVFCHLMPIVILMGFVGHPVTSIHFFIEVFNKYVFGICGSGSLLYAFLTLLFHGAMQGVVCAVMWWGNTGSRALMFGVIFTAFIMNFSIRDFTQWRHFRLSLGLFYWLIPPVLAGSGAFGLFIREKDYKPVCYACVAVHCLFDLLLPYVQSQIGRAHV